MTDPSTVIGDTATPNLAIDVMPSGGVGDFTVDRSEVGGPDRLGTPGAATWLNVVCDVTDLRVTRGATRSQGVLTRTEAGECRVRLFDPTRRFDPTINADAVHANTPVRVRAWGSLPELEPVTVRTQRVPNPRAALNTSGWTVNYGTGGAGALTRVASGWPTDGGAYARATWSTGNTSAAGTSPGAAIRADGRAASARPIPVSPGQILAGAIEARSSIGQRLAAQLLWWDAAGVQIGSAVTGPAVAVAAGAVARLTVPGAVVPAGAAYGYVGAVTTSGAGVGPFGVGATLDASLALLEAVAAVGDQPGAYFDGDGPDDADLEVEGALVHEWLGSPGFTVSYEREMQWVDTPWSEVLFTGTVETVGIAYFPSGDPEVELVAVDAVAALTAWQAAGRPDPGVGAGDTLRGRVDRVLAEMGGVAPTTVSTDSDVAYLATLAPTVLDKPWDILGAATDAELGALWIDRENRIVTRARGSLLSGPVRGTLSDWHGETVGDFDPHVCYSAAPFTLDPGLLRNRATGARRSTGTEDAPATAQLDDAYSQARYGLRATTDTSLDLETDAQVLPWLRELLLEGVEPELRVPEVTPAPVDGYAWRAVVATDIGDRWAFRLHPDIGPTAAMTLGVLGIAHDVTPAGWSVTLATAWAPTPGAANPSGWLTVDVSTIDDGDVLAGFA